MAIAYKCDRCKNHFDGQPLATVEIEVDTNQPQNYYDKITDARKELCSDCSRHIFDELTSMPPTAESE